jgi:hypothetical protein
MFDRFVVRGLKPRLCRRFDRFVVRGLKPRLGPICVLKDTTTSRAAPSGDGSGPVFDRFVVRGLKPRLYRRFDRFVVRGLKPRLGPMVRPKGRDRQRSLWVTAVLTLHVRDHPSQLSHSNGTQIVALRPPQRLVSSDPIPVRDSGARPFEALHQSRDVEGCRKLHDDMHMVPHDSQFDNPRAVSIRLCNHEVAQEGCDRIVDQGESGERGPDSMRKQANRHVVPLGIFCEVKD